MSTVRPPGRQLPFTVRIIGDGPAALATAIGLLQGGVAVRCRPPRRPATASALPPRADSLSPGGHALLARLGVAGAFAADGHLPCHAHACDWGPGGLRHLDFISHPQGSAWQVDRGRFDGRLRERALALGLQWEPPDGTEAAPPVQAIVDASGRSSHFARRQGARRLRGDRQLAWLASAPAAHAPGDGMSLVEATADGWWYSAPAPCGRWSLACFTDADLRPPPAQGHAGWLQRLAAAPRTLDRLIAHGVDARHLALQPARLLAADSSRLDRFCGSGWLAVGDAAMGFDPLSAHGLTVALQSGLHAAQALIALRDGDAQALPAYAARLADAFDAYQRQRLALYRDETRHACHRYWQRRRHGGYDGTTSSSD
ncbi:NAD(P)/FAD-dependent oxidoreductase [Aquincola sp. J276]|uniref:NAD(P)/FAD-dependent oxidoreductase n=1 Tax=Aquincola sp. J276 TaxID=2898432 RepID=UPI0021511819|nr:hypothetical protein [Aquincola sp. J276]MCR5863844.1 hypothetical protein [Aquincola sp. J276]